MNPERWQQIEKLYHEALERRFDERAAFLETACGGDVALRQEVDTLLASHQQAETFLVSPALEVAAQAVAQEQLMAGPGQKVGHYHLLSLLGKGGMGEVYLAADTRYGYGGRKVALKLLPAEFTQLPERVRRFQQEARAAMALHHPNIITILEVGQAEDTHYIATEFITGETLRHRLSAERMKLDKALDVGIQAARALAAAHEAGITHRDIKPENLMLGPDDYVKVLDFGLAKLSEQRRTDDDAAPFARVETSPGMVMGTVSYMSPEQARGLVVDARTDIFSLGVVLYEMATGCLPFAGETSTDVMAAILEREPLPLAQYAPEAPPALQRMVSKALAKGREQRYQSARELLSELQELRQELEFAAKLKRVGRAPSKEGGEGERPVTESLDAAQVASFNVSTTRPDSLDPAGGAMPLESKFYIPRPTDDEFRAAIARRDSIVLLKGARQVGKTSLLARGLQQARIAGASVVLTDFQNLDDSSLESVEKLLPALAEMFADQLGLEVFPDQTWTPHLSPIINFERYLRREVLGKTQSPVVWGLDEVDRLFTCDFGSQVFGLFRSWHNKRALDPAGPWQRLTLAIAYATEAHLFITNLNQSPFNVGTRLALEDFTLGQVSELNRRYGSPLRGHKEVARYFRLLGGHPFLAHCGLRDMAAHGLGIADWEAQADSDQGPFGEHLRRLLTSLSQDAGLREVVRGMLRGEPCPDPGSFYRLRAAGLVAGETAADARMRCQLYATYLKKHLS